MPPRERRPPRWTSDYVTEEPPEEGRQPWTGRTRSGRQVTPPARYASGENPSFAARGITPQSSRPRPPEGTCGVIANEEPRMPGDHECSS